MPPKKSIKPQQKKVTVKEITCVMCGETRKISEFYQSFNPLHATAKLPYCKICLKNMCLDSKGNVDVEKLKDMLKLIDRPFLYDIVKSSFDDKMDTIGVYMKNLAMPQYRDLGWKDSIFEPQLENNYINNNSNNQKPDNFSPDDIMFEKWGYGYSNEEYFYFEKKYNLLKNNYSEKTAMHTEALLNYIRYRVKEELSTARGDVKEAKEWGQLAKEAATAAKINPSQLSAADLADGLSTFGQLSRAVEQAVDIIEILPRFKERPQDKVDFTLWCYINYVRDLKGLPLCEYKNIYEFIEERRKEYENRSTNVEDNEEGE